VTQATYPGGTLAFAMPPPDDKGCCHSAATLWKTIQEPLDGEDDFDEKRVPHVLAGGSCSVEGPAGTGKTEVLKLLETKLQAQGKRVAKICITHVGTRNIGRCAITAHAFVSRHILHGTLAGDVVLIDEISFVSLEFIAMLGQLRLKGTRLIAFGDYEKLPPISSEWRGQIVGAPCFKETALVRAWADSTTFQLRRCRRSDQAHYDFYTAAKSQPLEQALESAMARHPPSSGPCEHNIVISSWHRQCINEQLQERAANAYDGPKVRIPRRKVPLDCFVGTKLIGCNTILKGVVNGAFLRVTAVDSRLITAQDEDTREVVQMTADQTGRHCRLRWVLTVHSAQGRSLGGTPGVHDLNNNPLPQPTSTWRLPVREGTAMYPCSEDGGLVLSYDDTKNILEYRKEIDNHE
jgi:hypothetical protein